MPWGGSERDLKSKQTLDNWRLLQLNIIQRQAKNELEVLSEQLEKLEKQTQYTTGKTPSVTKALNINGFLG